MGVPKKHKTPGSTGQRRAHHALKRTSMAKCSNCQEAVMPHMVCSNCGYYKGKKIQ